MRCQGRSERNQGRLDREFRLRNCVLCKQAEIAWTDLDMVTKTAAFKVGDYRRVTQDISDLMAVARPFDVPFRVIIKIDILTETERTTAALSVCRANPLGRLCHQDPATKPG